MKRRKYEEGDKIAYKGINGFRYTGIARFIENGWVTVQTRTYGYWGLTKVPTCAVIGKTL